MPLRVDPKIIVFFLILVASQIYMIGAFGSVEASHGHPASGYRETSRYLILLTSIAGIFLLPSRRASDFPFPKLPKVLIAILGFLMLWGVVSILNAKSDQRVFEFIYRPAENILWVWGPGSETSTTSRGFVAELAIMIAFVVMIAKSTQSGAWKGILASFALCGVAVTLVGIGHKVMDAQYIYGLEKIEGRIMTELPELYFAPFIYNANAASFLNFTTAIALGLAFYNRRLSPYSQGFFLWLAVAGVCALGVIAAASKAGVILLVFQLGLFVLWEGKFLINSFKKQKGSPPMTAEKKIALGIVTALFLLLASLVVSTVVLRFEELIEKSKTEQGSSTVEGRKIMRSLVWDVVSDQEKVGWRGTGPGSFAHFMPFLITEDLSDKIDQHWQYAHCDPLQTIAEWGYPGALAWFLLGAIAIWRAAKLGWTQAEGSANSHIFKALAIGMIGISIHSTYDFPFSVFSIHVMIFTALSIMWNLKGKSSSQQSSMRS